MNIDILIKNSLEYFDKNSEENEKIINQIKYYNFINKKTDIDINKLEIYDKDKKQIASYAYDVIGIYNSQTSVWAWSWSVPFMEKSKTNIARKLLNYATDLTHNEMQLKLELTSSRFFISDKTQLDIHVAMASYLTKSQFVFKLYLDTHSNSDTQRESDFKKIITTPKGEYLLYYIILHEIK